MSESGFNRPRPKYPRNTNAWRNHQVRKKMDFCEATTGMSAEALTERQRQMREQFYARQGKVTPYAEVD